MYDDAQDAIAAEYVLGTLSADEREHAEALMAIDPSFAEAVQMWERRLGELNVMVEAVEPPPELWDKIRSEIGMAAQPSEALPPSEASMPADEVSLTSLLSAAAPEIEAEHEAGTEAGTTAEATAEAEPESTTATPSPADALAASLLPSSSDDVLPEGVSESITASLAESLAEPLPAERPKRGGELRVEPRIGARAEPGIDSRIDSRLGARGERSAEVVYLARRVARWRRLTVALGALAALLALYVGVSQFASGLMPFGNKPANVAAQQTPARLAARLVGVLQQDPTSPAFLLTIDPQSRTLVVRRVSATPEPGKSYELWLIAGRAAPHSLGLVGKDEFTQRALPANFDVDTLRGASYAVSLEPPGGSPSGAPTGPVLFTGKLVESVPAAAPPQTPKT
jgi:anti-sigma-K factor RskA